MLLRELQLSPFPHNLLLQTHFWLWCLSSWLQLYSTGYWMSVRRYTSKMMASRRSLRSYSSTFAIIAFWDCSTWHSIKGDAKRRWIICRKERKRPSIRFNRYKIVFIIVRFAIFLAFIRYAFNNNDKEYLN